MASDCTLIDNVKGLLRFYDTSEPLAIINLNIYTTIRLFLFQIGSDITKSSMSNKMLLVISFLILKILILDTWFRKENNLGNFKTTCQQPNLRWILEHLNQWLQCFNGSKNPMPLERHNCRSNEVIHCFRPITEVGHTRFYM